jgi:cytoskeletal protein CcmA (bactofilin family)
MAKNNDTENTASINFLSAATSITGDIRSDGDFRIDGTLKGSLHSKGKVVIGKSGNVEGEIICENADISGTITGKIVVFELLDVKATAKIDGDIFTNKLAVEPGAKFTGTCNMNEIPKPESTSGTKDGKIQEKEKAVK